MSDDQQLKAYIHYYFHQPGHGHIEPIEGEHAKVLYAQVVNRRIPSDGYITLGDKTIFMRSVALITWEGVDMAKDFPRKLGGCSSK